MQQHDVIVYRYNYTPTLQYTMCVIVFRDWTNIDQCYNVSRTSSDRDGSSWLDLSNRLTEHNGPSMRESDSWLDVTVLLEQVHHSSWQWIVTIGMNSTNFIPITTNVFTHDVNVYWWLNRCIFFWHCIAIELFRSWLFDSNSLMNCSSG